MKIVKGTAAWLKLRAGPLFKGKTVGFVPTMGALHAGHRSLLKRAKKDNSLSIASIFVNPAQFNDKRDLARYPRTLAGDIEILQKEKTDFLLLPGAGDMYPDGYRYRLSENSDSKVLCGAHRPGHFEGVLTVVLKLLNLVRADKAYFGEKDYQQFHLVREMAEAFFTGTKIIPCPTLREADGLAMSSRNLLLTTEERQLAPALYKALRSSARPEEINRQLSELGFEPEYIEERWGRRFAAAKLGKVRLIDNVKLAFVP
ncbi:MAG: pantoate--beta-alanine ligase [Elusimicrobia bacterium CG_4_10_14_0_2_um_filter_56_8]|nr:MAG: pantoate--beta-alanine ligase [Elusimicrobia bacterium CG1_02_56_21]PJA12689.1 MAG: pantoate--beta-alanine ligase [Elusimicrobia bacterium CG_4_10_14_0_2_um_filter_56_8]